MDALRLGKISSVNYPNGTARVTYPDRDDDTTPEIPFLAWEYWMPKIGETVLTAHLQNGPAAAVILGPVWHGGHRPVEGFPGLYRKEYANEPGLAGERYDAQSGDYRQSVTGAMLISASESWAAQVENAAVQIHDGGVTITAPGVTIRADAVRVLGDLSVEGNITATGNVTADGVSLRTHTHTGTHGETTGPH